MVLVTGPQVGDGTYNIIMQIVPLGVPGAMLAVFLITSFVWWRMAVVYQHRIRELRMGRCERVTACCQRRAGLTPHTWFAVTLVMAQDA